jgi:hypothetical protein
LTSSLGNSSPVAALHSSSAFDRSTPHSTSAWILASVIVDRTHAVRGSEMQAASTAISLLGFELDLIWHRFLMHMHRRIEAQSGGASSGLAGVGSWASEREGVVVARPLWSKKERKRRERQRLRGRR